MKDIPFDIGQQVYVADASSYGTVEVPCPICFGDKFVVLILGNGERQEIECEACGLGFNGPRGFVNEHAPTSRVSLGTVTGIQWDSFHDSWRIFVNGFTEKHVFSTKDEAEACRVDLYNAAKADSSERWKSMMDGKKKHHAWSAHYHRSQLREIEAKAEYHRAKLRDPRIRERKVKP